MRKEVISDNQAISIMILFLAGTSTVLIMALEAEGDFWIAILLSVAIAAIMVLILVYLHGIFPEKNLFDICEDCFGKIIGKAICILYIYFVFEEGTATLINFKQFITETSIPETPQTVAIIPLILLCAFAVKGGIEVIGRCANFFVMVFLIFLFTMIMLLIPKMDMNNFEPILYKGIKPVFKGAISAFAFPFGEVMMLAMVFSNFKNKKSSYKVYLTGLFTAGMIALAVSLTTVSVLGIDIATTSYFPAFNAASGINVGNFIQRLEILAALVGILGAFIKISILLLATCKGILKVFNLTDYRFIIIPVSLLMLNYSNIIVDSRMEFVQWNAEAWTYYAAFLEISLPIILLIAALVRKKKLRI